MSYYWASDEEGFVMDPDEGRDDEQDNEEGEGDAE